MIRWRPIIDQGENRAEEQAFDNVAIAELLAAEASRTQPPLQRALRRAARRALLWPEEATQLLRTGRSLQELPGIGPHLERLILGWLEHPPAFAPIPRTRQGFLTRTRVRAALGPGSLWTRLLRGDLQMHTLWSDGADSIAAMADAAEAQGYEYIAITDHSKGLHIAGGIDEAQLAEQRTEIDEVNRALEERGSWLHVLHSLELNLSPSGEGDMDPSALADLDLVLGCFHSSLRRTDDQTERYERALRNPSVHILGHPQGRIYNYRVGLNADWPRVFAVAAELDKAVEIDCYPDRQDLSLDLLLIAKQAGCRISLATDAHRPRELELMEFGLAAARLSAIDSERILNFMSRDELLTWADKVRQAAAA